jgi:hypothetical protein
MNEEIAIQRRNDRFAPEGTVWVCGACGKTHKDRYGIEGKGSRSWDESCMLNAILCMEEPVVEPSGKIVWSAVNVQNKD